jgi:hypothetical protein
MVAVCLHFKSTEKEKLKWNKGQDTKGAEWIRRKERRKAI